MSRSSRSRNEPPPRYSNTRYGPSWSSPQSKTRNTCGWFSEATERASARKRFRNASSVANPGWRTFTAT